MYFRILIPECRFCCRISTSHILFFNSRSGSTVRITGLIDKLMDGKIITGQGCQKILFPSFQTSTLCYFSYFYNSNLITQGAGLTTGDIRTLKMGLFPLVCFRAGSLSGYFFTPCDCSVMSSAFQAGRKKQIPSLLDPKSSYFAPSGEKIRRLCEAGCSSSKARVLLCFDRDPYDRGGVCVRNSISNLIQCAGE